MNASATESRSGQNFAAATQRTESNVLTDWKPRFWLGPSPQRIHPAQPWKARKAAIGGVQHAAILHGQCRQVRIARHRTRRLSVDQHALQLVPMALSWRENPHMRQVDPLLDRANGALDRNLAARDARICR